MISETTLNIRSRNINMSTESPKTEESKKPLPQGAFILTRSGKRINIIDPSQDDIVFDDIVRSLNNTCRYTGHVPFYSVLQHSLELAYFIAEAKLGVRYMGIDPAGMASKVVASNLSPEDKLLLKGALLHDASEYLLGDISSPLKQLIPDYKIFEANVTSAIERKFDLSGLTNEQHRIIKEYDINILLWEMSNLFITSGDLGLPPVTGIYRRAMRYMSAGSTELHNEYVRLYEAVK